MKEFMLLFRGGNEMSRNLSPDEAQADMQRWNKWIDEIAQKGQFISGQPLLSGGKIISGKSKKITDGPFMEMKEVIGGYVQVKVRDLEEAVTISNDCPILLAEDGSVEIREIGTM